MSLFSDTDYFSLNLDTGEVFTTAALNQEEDEFAGQVIELQVTVRN